MFLCGSRSRLVILTFYCLTTLQVLQEVAAISCYDCTTGYLHLHRWKNFLCPEYGSVKIAPLTPPCNGRCIIRNFTGASPHGFIRSCTDHLALPKLLPESGCYSEDGKALYCLCNSNLCNGQSVHAMLQNRSMKDLPSLSSTIPKPNKTDEIVDEQNKCYICQSSLNGKINDNCPGNDYLTAVTRIYKYKCTGVCYVRTGVPYPGVVFRGCSDSDYKFPTPAPKDGCYKYMKNIYCICQERLCNTRPLDHMLQRTIEDLPTLLSAVPKPTKTDETEDGPHQCYICQSSLKGKINDDCPGNGSLKALWKIYKDNNCSGICYVRTNLMFPGVVFRGCSDFVWKFPTPAPKDGCYKYKKDIFCICQQRLCNTRPLDLMLQDRTVEDLPSLLSAVPKPNKTDETEDGPHKCYICQSSVNGKINDNCPGNGSLKALSTIYKENCTGICYIRTNVRLPGVVFRGCSDFIWKFPTPTPKDGCYNYYTDVFCICRRSLCNTEPLGKPKTTKELDYLQKQLNKNKSLSAYYSGFLMLTSLYVGMLANNSW